MPVKGIAPRRPSRPLDRPEGPAADDRGNDGGVDVTTTAASTWYAPPLPIGQFYHVVGRHPRAVPRRRHDAGHRHGRRARATACDGTASSRRLVRRRRRRSRARRVRPDDPNIVYAGEYGGYLSRYDHRTRQAAQRRVYPENPSGHGGEDMKYRFQWTAPIALSPHDPERRLSRRQRAVPHDRRRPDLDGDQRRPDAQRQDQAAVVRRPDHRRQHRRRDLLHHLRDRRVAASSGRHLGRQRRRPGARHARRRQDLEERHAGDDRASRVGHGRDASSRRHFDAGTAYVVVDAHRLDDMQPYLFKTADFGADVDAARREAAAGRLPARRPRGPGAAGPALPRHRARRHALDRRRRHLAAAAAQPADRRGARPGREGQRRSSSPRTGRSFWILDDLRPCAR